jgi:signal transduction histidine kinase
MAKTILNDSSKAINREVQVIAILASSIAHEVRNYLAAISICAELSEKQLSNIRERVKAASYLIGNLQLQIKGVVIGKPETKDFKRCSMARNVMETLEQYPLKDNEQKLIKYDLRQDFEYIGNPILTNHVLYNLIKNALRAISNAGKGVIAITLQHGLEYNRLIFKDTATGIPKEFIPKMFKLFESQSIAQGGTGIGLAYCKLIMQSYGGDIVCDSIEGKYASFVLSFPPI